MPYNAADKIQVGEAKHKAKNKQHQLNADYKKLMSEPWGRRLLWRWLSDSGLYHNCFTGNSETYFRLGIQAAGQRMLSELVTADKTAYARLLIEFSEEDTDAESGK